MPVPSNTPLSPSLVTAYLQMCGPSASASDSCVAASEPGLRLLEGLAPSSDPFPMTNAHSSSRLAPFPSAAAP
jgi:hypothetical protein